MPSRRSTRPSKPPAPRAPTLPEAGGRSFGARLHAWYRRDHRDLPWRRTADPYRIWISEILLQQTQVGSAIGRYEQFLARFPDVAALAAAPLDDVLLAWEGAGYYARARNLHLAARRIVEEHGGELPRSVAALRSLPGVGPYTAAAVASIAFGIPEPVLDGNVERVLCRAFAVGGDPHAPATRRALLEIARGLLPRGHAGDHNQAAMELGATICTPRRPRCGVCPVERLCEARASDRVELLPERRPRRARPHHVVAVGLLWRRGRVLIQRRPDEGLLGGLWEFPGGKLEPGETLAACLRRELLEELGLEVEVGREVAVVEHAYTHFSITLHAFDCFPRPGARARGPRPRLWVLPRDLVRHALPAANRRLVPLLRPPPRAREDRAPRRRGRLPR
jgi:A/G-specific adenine glycosylase